MDGVEIPVQVPQQGIETNAAVVNPQIQTPAQRVYDAAAFGWSLTELLGRAFVLKEEAYPPRAWTGTELVMLPEIRSPREKLLALMEHIIFLACSLDVSSFLADQQDNSGQNNRYVDVVKEQVDLLVTASFDTSIEQPREAILARINECLYYWDFKIHEALQNGPKVFHAAYTVGQNLASLRWYFGLQEKILDEACLEKICDDYLPLMASYLPTYSPGAVIYSVKLWGEAIINNQVKPDSDGKPPLELQRQTNIWYSLITGDRNPLSYVDPSAAGTQFILRVVRISWPLFIMSFLALALIVVVLLVVILSHIDVVLKEITAVVGLLALAGTSHSAASNLSGILQKAVSEASGSIKGSLVDSLWKSTQQKAVNKATCIVPAPVSSDQSVSQKPQVPG